MAFRFLFTFSLSLLLFGETIAKENVYVNSMEVENEPSFPGVAPAYFTDSYGKQLEFHRLLTDADDKYEPEDLEGSSVDCDVCIWFVGEVQKLAKKKGGEKLVVDFAVDYCKTKKLQDDRVCEMTVHQFKDVGLFVIQKGKFLPEELCGRYFDSVCPPYEGPWWDVTFPNTTKPTPKPPTPPKPEAPKMKFLTLTDIHVDFQYKEGTLVKCGEPLCCRDFKKPNGYVQLEKERAGRYGNPMHCDACLDMANNMFQHLATIKDQFDYIVFLGDVPAHDIWNQTQDTQLAHVNWLDKMFSTYLPDKPVYYTLGNHEAVPVDNYAIPAYKEFTMDWLYTPIVDLWGKWLDDKSRATIKACGMYSFSPYPGFRIISINTNYANARNFFLMLNATDPCNTLQWLVGELQGAEDNGEKVHFLTHAPNDGTLKPWSYNFYDIVNRYENTIVNMFNGHKHQDWFQLYYDNDTSTRPLGHAWVGPAASGHTSLYPSYRIYTIDGNYPGSSWAVLDYDSFYMNVTQANIDHNPQWKFAYNPKAAYNMTSLYAKDMDELAHRIGNDKATFDVFYRNYFSLHKPDEVCDEKCKAKIMKKLLDARK